MKTINKKFDDVMLGEIEEGKVTFVIETLTELNPNTVKNIKNETANKTALSYSGWKIESEELHDDFRTELTKFCDEIGIENVGRFSDIFVTFPTAERLKEYDYELIKKSLVGLKKLIEKEDNSDMTYYIKNPYYWKDTEEVEEVKELMKELFEDIDNLVMVEYTGEPVVLEDGEAYVGYMPTALKASKEGALIVGAWFSDDMKKQAEGNIHVCKFLSDQINIPKGKEDQIDNFVLTEIFTKSRMKEVIKLIDKCKKEGTAVVFADWEKEYDSIGCMRRLLTEKLKAEYDVELIELN